jgi:hypothetical protein
MMVAMTDARRSRFRAARNAPADVILDVMQPYVAGDDWDRPHRLLAICWDGQKAWVDQESLAPLSMHPNRIGLFIMRRSEKAFERHKAVAEEGAVPTLYAVAFVSEGHSVADVGPDADRWERARMRRDRRAWAADIDGRTYCLALRADRPHDPMTRYTIEVDDDVRATGPVVEWVRAAAVGFGVLLRGDSLPTPARSRTAEDSERVVLPISSRR